MGLADELSAALRQVVVLGGRSFHTSASVGVAVIDDAPEVDAETAVRRADIAMFEGKRTGSNSVTRFAPEMERRVVMRAELEGQLRATLTGAGPDVVFQPVVHLRSGRTVAVEALARWHSPTHGPVGPDRFVPMAERIGVIDQLDRHVMRKACKSIRDFREPTSGMLVDLTVNASTVHLSNHTVAQDVLEVISDHGFPANRLILEVTESSAVADDALLRDQLHQLRAEGVRIAIDDFGTGHSSLAQLETLPVDIVKIDRSFLTDVPESGRRLRYVETIINMANALDLAVIFEGIERPAQAEVLTDLGVQLGQGYLLAEPAGSSDLGHRMDAASNTVTTLVSDRPHAQQSLPWDGGMA
jgi:predicted signal transduction protein with EAL and GGDEF domain